MAKARNKKDIPARDDARFEEFLQEQFRQLRAELDRFEPVRKGVDGKLLQLPQAKASSSTFWQKIDSWRYTIAASVLLAVAVPTVIQMNQEQRDSVVQATAQAGEKPRLESKETITNSNDEIEEAEGSSSRPRQTERRAAKKLAKSKTRIDDEEAFAAREKDAPGGGMAKRELADELMAASPAPAEVKGRAAEGAPAPESAKVMPAAPASRAMAEKPAEAKPAASVSRSAPIADAQANLKQDRIAEDEKSEMERLWKEFEKDPEAFQQDKKRSARLKTLLARHDTKSRARRMKSQLTQ